MQQIVTQLAQKHGLDLSAPSTHLRLEMKHMDRLVIEKVDCHVLSVAHYYSHKGVLIADPEVVFFTADDHWIPVAVTQVLGGRRYCAYLSTDGDQLAEVDEARQASATVFVNEMWASNLESQDWLDRARKGVLVTPNTERRFPLGKLVRTAGVTEALAQADQDPFEFYGRHQAGDWGKLDEEDKQQNDLSVKRLQGRILSAYILDTGVKIWLITEWDRSVTTALLPDEY
jgi:hypothetical protein